MQEQWHKKGVGDRGQMDWLIQGMSEELKGWRHAGGIGGYIILSSDGEPALVSLKQSLARYRGGRVTIEKPAQGESQRHDNTRQRPERREYVQTSQRKKVVSLRQTPHPSHTERRASLGSSESRLEGNDSKSRRVDLPKLTKA